MASSGQHCSCPHAYARMLGLQMANVRNFLRVYQGSGAYSKAAGSFDDKRGGGPSRSGRLRIVAFPGFSFGER